MPEPLRPYQIRGAQFLVTRDRALLGDDTGLGKSVQSITAAHVRGASRVLVLCPAIGRVSWAIEFAKWCPGLPVVQFGPSLKVIPEGDVALIVTYDMLSRANSRSRLMRLLARVAPFDAAILDEGHQLKNPTAQRTKGVYGPAVDLEAGLLRNALSDDAAIWLMSATIQKANALDLWPHLRALFPDVLTQLMGPKATSKVAFVEQFCTFYDGPYGREITGNNPKTMPALIEALRPHALIRRKADVAPELGTINQILLPLAVPEEPEAPLAPDEQAFLDNWERASVEGHPATPPPQIMQRWRELGDAKAGPAVDWITDFLAADPGRKLVVFAHHRNVIQAITNAFPATAVALHGGSAANMRRLAVDMFQTDPTIRLFVGQTHAAGTSITLTAASDVLVLEPEWTPADTYQAISRVHRLGQTEPVTAYFAYVAGSVDERIAAVARRKQRDFEQLQSGLMAEIEGSMN